MTFSRVYLLAMILFSGVSLATTTACIDMSGSYSCINNNTAVAFPPMEMSITQSTNHNGVDIFELQALDLDEGNASSFFLDSGAYPHNEAVSHDGFRHNVLVCDQSRVKIYTAWIHSGRRILTGHEFHQSLDGQMLIDIWATEVTGVEGDSIKTTGAYLRTGYSCEKVN